MKRHTLVFLMRTILAGGLSASVNAVNDTLGTLSGTLVLHNLRRQLEALKCG